MKEKPRKSKNSTYTSPQEMKDEIKRLNRIVGQVEGIRKMMEEQRALGDILIQCKAVHSALKAVESRVLQRHLDRALADIGQMEKRKAREQKIAQLMDLYRPVM